MVWLEHHHLVSQGYDPSTDLVDTVAFGAVQTAPDQWDLGILDIKVRKMSHLGEPIAVEPSG